MMPAGVDGDNMGLTNWQLTTSLLHVENGSVLQINDQGISSFLSYSCVT